MEINFTLNGRAVTAQVGPDDTLLEVLRGQFGLLGTKEACGRGECGACTVLLDGEAVISCILPAAKATGRRVLTIEGLGQREQLHPIQQAFIDAGAVQCGYCIPGMVMSAKALLDKNLDPTREEIERGMSGNICRCTGYVQIIEAVQLASERMRKNEND